MMNKFIDMYSSPSWEEVTHWHAQIFLAMKIIFTFFHFLTLNLLKSISIENKTCLSNIVSIVAVGDLAI